MRTLLCALALVARVEKAVSPGGDLAPVKIGYSSSVRAGRPVKIGYSWGEYYKEFADGRVDLMESMEYEELKAQGVPVAPPRGPKQGAAVVSIGYSWGEYYK